MCEKCLDGKNSTGKAKSHGSHGNGRGSSSTDEQERSGSSVIAGGRDTRAGGVGLGVESARASGGLGRLHDGYGSRGVIGNDDHLGGCEAGFSVSGEGDGGHIQG